MTIILAGASNLASIRPIFESNGAVVIDLTKPGWMITESNVESLKSEISALSTMEDVAIIFDLFGNTAYRFKHVDGSLVLPFRVGGGYHLLGDIHVVSDTGIGELVSLVKPLFVLCALFLTVIMPPSHATCSLGAAGKAAIPPTWGMMAFPARFWMSVFTSEKF
jgi:hypothetical protein